MGDIRNDRNWYALFPNIIIYGFEYVPWNMLTDLYLLTHCGLVMPYGDLDLGQHWLM